MNTMIQAFIDNEKQIFNSALKYIRNKELTQDMIQKTYLSLLEFPKEAGSNPIAYLNFMVKGKYLNEIREHKYKKYTTYELPAEILDESQADMVETLDNKFKLETTLDIMEIVCSNKEKEAVYHILSTDDQTVGIDGGSFETLKSNRKWAIKKIKRFFDENNYDS